MRLGVLALAAVLACASPGLFASGKSSSHSPTHSTTSSHGSGSSHSSTGSHISGSSHSSSGSHGSGSSHSSSKSQSAGSPHSSTGSHSKAVPGVHRDSHGKIARDPRQTNAFKKQHPCPSTGKLSGSCPGYVIDHVIPLKRGGADSPSNMQWQTEGAAKLKDRTE